MMKLYQNLELKRNRIRFFPFNLMLVTLIVGLAFSACPGRGPLMQPPDIVDNAQGLPCPCPGGQPSVMRADAQQGLHCACFLQQQPLSEGLGVYALLDAAAQPFWRFQLPESIDNVLQFLPAQGLLLASQHDRACGESLSTYSLRDGHKLSTLTPADQCLSDSISSTDRERLFVLNQNADTGHFFAFAYQLGVGSLEPQGSAIDLGSGIPRSHSAVATGPEQMLVPILTTEEAGASSTTRHSFMQLDFAQGEAQPLFLLDPTAWMEALHVSQHVAVIEISDSHAPEAEHVLAAYDLSSGRLMATQAGQLLSSQGAPIFFRDPHNQLRSWSPWNNDSSNNISDSYGEGGFSAHLSQDAVALTGMGTGHLQTWLFRLSTAQEMLRFDGANFLEAGEELRSEILFVHSHGSGMIQHLYICQPGACGGGPLVLSRAGHRDYAFYAEPIRNSQTVALGQKDPADTANPYTLFALDPQNLELQQVGDFSAQATTLPIFASGLHVWR